MTVVINSNIAALTSQRALLGTSAQLSTSLQRLSSGLRINSSKDDAAGLAIAQRLTTQVRGYSQAIRNAADGISLAQTADGALESINNSLQRMRELTVQSANFTNTMSDRTAINQEALQLRDEIHRVAMQARFNGRRLLDGSFTGAVLQVGANVGESIHVEAIAGSTPSDLGRHFDIDGLLLMSTGMLRTINIAPVGGGPEMVIGDIAGEEPAEMVASINGTGIDGLFAYAQSTPLGARLGVSYFGEAQSVWLHNFTEDSPDELNQGLSVTDIDLTTVGGATNANLSIDSALAAVSQTRAKLGAIMNRFEQTISNLRITTENQTASRSRIQDADFAVETAALTRTQILQQSGMELLQWANAVPRNVLTLLT